MCPRKHLDSRRRDHEERLGDVRRSPSPEQQSDHSDESFLRRLQEGTKKISLVPDSRKFYTRTDRLVEGIRPPEQTMTEEMEDILIEHGTYAKPLRRIEGPTNAYNCHGLVFFQKKVWYEGDIRAILSDQGFKRVDSARPEGVNVILCEKDGKDHSGILIHLDPTDPLKHIVEDKQGEGSHAEHFLGDIQKTFGPYEIYHSSDPDARHLIPKSVWDQRAAAQRDKSSKEDEQTKGKGKEVS